ncbi:unnamed protein product [Cercopithifilaria johnstoni]|uniref:Uncharacterized protein n=1 Tax=Cercopithifilaria johnstoni TaxID=2874296 RepID=A0A8J2Q771_9BILA|nr:unnamed protein product [Cercopithifilaria johnstoni]
MPKQVCFFSRNLGYLARGDVQSGGSCDSLEVELTDWDRLVLNCSLLFSWNLFVSSCSLLFSRTRDGLDRIPDHGQFHRIKPYYGDRGGC